MMNGFFDFFTGGASDKSVGTEVLKAYYDEASLFPEFTYGSYDAWMTYLNSIVEDYESFIGNLVNINSASTTVGQAANRVVDLANKSGGLAKIQNITMAAGGRGDTINWMEAIPTVATDTVTDTAAYAVEVAQNVGEGVKSTLSMVKYLPWILGGGALIYFMGPKLLSSAIRKNPRKKYRKTKRKVMSDRELEKQEQKILDKLDFLEGFAPGEEDAKGNTVESLEKELDTLRAIKWGRAVKSSRDDE